MLANEMVIFYYVAQLKSFSKAAHVLSVSKSFISKRITQLEKDLKTNLLTRSTRQFKLTEAGEAFYQHCQKLVAQAERGYEEMSNLRGQPSGVLKIAAPPALGVYLLTPILAQFAQAYPEVKINVVLESRLVDIIQENFDVVLRTGVLPDSSLIAQKVTNFRNTLCASPGYLKKHGAIKTPNQLNQHLIAIYSANKSTQKIMLTKNQQVFNITIESCFQSNHLDLIHQMVIADCCMAALPEFMVKTALAEKKLVHCLPDYQLKGAPLYVLYPEKEFMPIKARIFIEMLKEHLRREI